MFLKKRCCCKKNRFPFGAVFISAGVGLMLAYIIPYYLLIVMLGVSLISAGIYFIRKN